MVDGFGILLTWRGQIPQGLRRDREFWRFIAKVISHPTLDDRSEPSAESPLRRIALEVADANAYGLQAVLQYIVGSGGGDTFSLNPKFE